MRLLSAMLILACAAASLAMPSTTLSADEPERVARALGEIFDEADALLSALESEGKVAEASSMRMAFRAAVKHDEVALENEIYSEVTGRWENAALMHEESGIYSLGVAIAITEESANDQDDRFDELHGLMVEAAEASFSASLELPITGTSTQEVGFVEPETSFITVGGSIAASPSGYNRTVIIYYDPSQVPTGFNETEIEALMSQAFADAGINICINLIPTTSPPEEMELGFVYDKYTWASTLPCYGPICYGYVFGVMDAITMFRYRVNSFTTYVNFTGQGTTQAGYLKGAQYDFETQQIDVNLDAARAYMENPITPGGSMNVLLANALIHEAVFHGLMGYTHYYQPIEEDELAYSGFQKADMMVIPESWADNINGTMSGGDTPPMGEILE